MGCLKLGPIAWVTKEDQLARRKYREALFRTAILVVWNMSYSMPFVFLPI